MQDKPLLPHSQAWKVLVAIGGIVGASFLIGSINGCSSTTPKAVSAPTSSAAPAASDNSKPAAAATPAAVPQTPAPQTAVPQTSAPPRAASAPAPVQTRSRRPESATKAHSSAATIVGQNGGATNIRKGPSSDYDVAHIGYPGDEVDVLDSSVDRSGTTWYHVRFLKSQATGWISGQFLSLEDSSYTPGQSSAPSQPEEIVRTDLETNATIGGESGPINIRSGPGPAYAELHIAYPGDRVLVIDSNTGTDGQPWYKVYFSKSKAEGWIAGFLLNLD